MSPLLHLILTLEDPQWQLDTWLQVHTHAVHGQRCSFLGLGVHPDLGCTICEWKLEMRTRDPSEL